MLSMDDLFKGRHFDREIIILCVRWYLRFKLNACQFASRAKQTLSM
jgi:transposase-like protein